MDSSTFHFYSLKPLTRCSCYPNIKIFQQQIRTELDRHQNFHFPACFKNPTTWQDIIRAMDNGDSHRIMDTRPRSGKESRSPKTSEHFAANTLYAALVDAASLAGRDEQQFIWEVRAGFIAALKSLLENVNGIACFETTLGYSDTGTLNGFNAIYVVYAAGKSETQITEPLQHSRL